MTTRFMLVRHGSCAQTDTTLLGRSVDAPLSARGEREAEAVAARLARDYPTRLFTSPRERTRQTAAIIADVAHCDVRIDDELDEIDFGRWSGQTFADLVADADWRTWNSDRARARTPAGETIADVQTRIVARLDALADAYVGESVVLVTHGEIIRTALLHFLSRPADAYQSLDIAPASLSRLRLHGGRATIDSINEHAALDACVHA